MLSQVLIHGCYQADDLGGCVYLVNPQPPLYSQYFLKYVHWAYFFGLVISILKKYEQIFETTQSESTLFFMDTSILLLTTSVGIFLSRTPASWEAIST